MAGNAPGALSHLKHKCPPFWKHGMFPGSLWWYPVGHFWIRWFQPPSPVLQSELIIQKLSSVWWKRFVSAFAQHSFLSSAECNAFLSLLLQALCTSTGPGNATCQCNVGWTGDGKACVAIDNCMQESRGNCHIHADCIYIGPGQVWAMLSRLMMDVCFLSCSVGLLKIETELASSKTCLIASRNTSFC